MASPPPPPPPPPSPSPVSSPEVERITALMDTALGYPESPLKTAILDALREVLVDYLCRASVAVFLEDNVKYAHPDGVANARSR